MNVNFIELCESAFEPLVPRVAAQFDLSKEKTNQIFDLGIAVMLAMVLKKMANKEGVSELYGAVSSTKIDANIAVNLVNIFHSSLIFNNLLELGGDQIKFLFHEKTSTFYEAVANETSTDPAIVKSLTKIASVCMHGLLKRYLRIHHGQPHVLILLFQKNLFVIKNKVNINIFVLMGVGKIEDFFQNVEKNFKTLIAEAEEANLNTLVLSQVRQYPQQNQGYKSSQVMLVMLAIVALLFVGSNFILK